MQYLRHIIIIVLLSPLAASSQDDELYALPDNFSIHISLGASVPSGPADFTNYWGIGNNIEFGLAYRPHQAVEFGTSFRYDRFPLNDTKLRAKAIREDALPVLNADNISIYSIKMFIRVHFVGLSEVAVPYLTAQLGEAWPQTGFIYGQQTDGIKVLARPVQKDRLNTFSFGLGLTLKTSTKFTVFLESNYRVMFMYFSTPAEPGTPPQERDRYGDFPNNNYMSVLIGLKYLFSLF